MCSNLALIFFISVEFASEILEKMCKYISKLCLLIFCMGYNVDMCSLSERKNNAVNLNYYESHC